MLVLVVGSLLWSPALAGTPGPVRCEAILTAPVEDCPLSGHWAASGFGRRESQARSHALERLEALIAAEAEVRVSRIAPGAATAQVRATVRSCPRRVADEARVHCFAEPSLAEERLCFASFEDDTCWPGPLLDMQGVAWKMMETGRDEVCEALAATLADAAPDERARCEARCLQLSRVRCPG